MRERVFRDLFDWLLFIQVDVNRDIVAILIGAKHFHHFEIFVGSGHDFNVGMIVLVGAFRLFCVDVEFHDIFSLPLVV